MRLAPRPTLLAGREELLAELDARLTRDETGASPRMVVLCGLGGVGKTSVAVEYAHRHLSEFGVVWQFSAEEPAVLAAGFGDLAVALGVHDLLTAGDPVAAVHGALAARPGGWLLIFDNVTEPAAIWATLPPGGRGRVLITAQDPRWTPSLLLEVPVLDQETATSFLVNWTDAAGQEAAARELAGKLGGLPLALEQAAAYMQATGLGIAGYLGLFRQRSHELLARGDPAGYDKRVTTTWVLAFERLEQTAPHAAGLLRLLACYASEAIPLNLLLQSNAGLADSFGPDVAPLLVPVLDDPLAASDAVAALRRYSLISAPKDGAVSVHRLVQVITVAQLPAKVIASWRQAAAALIQAALPSDPKLPANWLTYAALMAHVQASLPAHSDCMREIAEYLGQIGSYAAARELYLQILRTQEQVLGPEHPDTLTTRANLAQWTGRAGNPPAARDQYAELLPDLERVVGPEHPDTLHARGKLARWTGEAGDHAAARDLYAELLPVRERVLGPEHRDTLSARRNVARWTGEADPAAARDQFTKLLPVFERVLSADHPDTVTARGNLARWTGEAGDPATARDLYAELLTVDERVRGREHPSTLTARGNLARWTGEAGDPATARDLYAELLPVLERILGPEHPGTLRIRDSLAFWTDQAKRDRTGIEAAQ